MELTDQDKAALELEGRWWKYLGAKEQAIRDELGVTATAFYQRVNALIDRPEALAHAPQVVNRLRRVREQRRAARSGRLIA